ncbi:unnamed protein product [Prorocentrum cordatum]|uniref:Uncharacterized protein n=1 Tax=Prorocentrum cordatum TaxID=2364126 RepID=A0ABN9TJY5_9DINO|nr:unnamed protein product [Polarella glacialis]
MMLLCELSKIRDEERKKPLNTCDIGIFILEHRLQGEVDGWFFSAAKVNMEERPKSASTRSWASTAGSSSTKRQGTRPNGRLGYFALGALGAIRLLGALYVLGVRWGGWTVHHGPIQLVQIAPRAAGQPQPPIPRALVWSALLAAPAQLAT